MRGMFATMMAAAATTLIATTAGAQDIDARTTALIFDAVATPPGNPGSGATIVDPAALAAIRSALQQAGLLSPQRVATIEKDVVDGYGRALLLGSRARQFLPELAEVRNAAIRRDRPATAAAIERLFAKAGRPKPDKEQMAKYVADVLGAGEDEGPPETARWTITRPGRTIQITDARRAGLFTVEIFDNAGGTGGTGGGSGGGSPASGPPASPPSANPPSASGAPAANAPSRRSVVTAENRVRPTADGSGLEQRGTAVRACSNNAAQASERRARLNGSWQAGNAHWDIGGTADSITLTERRDDGRTLTYTGSYRLGRVEATHVVTHPDDIGKDLPMWVRAGLVGRTAFVVRLDDCGDGRLRGTWESRHVTYSPAFNTINRIHDPYDLPLDLARGGEIRTARGGRLPQEGP